jgi:hypothetical protein
VREGTGFTDVTVGPATATLERHHCVAREQIDIDEPIQGLALALRQGGSVMSNATSEVRFEITTRNPDVEKADRPAAPPRPNPATTTSKPANRHGTTIET